jgi:hypothetical protein
MNKQNHKSVVEICNHCGKSVAYGSGLFVNRILDLNDLETRKENKIRFIHGDFICRNCDLKSSDND